MAHFGSIVHPAVAAVLWVVWRRFRPTWGSPLLGAAAFAVLPWSILGDGSAGLLIPGITLLGLTALFLVQIHNPKLAGGEALWIALLTAICATVSAAATGGDPSAAAAYVTGVIIAGPVAAYCIRLMPASSRRKDDAGDRAIP